MTTFRTVPALVIAVALLVTVRSIHAQDSTRSELGTVSATRAGMLATSPGLPAQVSVAVRAGDGREASTDRARAHRAGPTLEAARVAAVSLPARTDHAVGNELAQQGGIGRAETFMIVGGAAFVAGLLIGDDAGTLVAVGGAAVGLYGLYLYLQTQ